MRNAGRTSAGDAYWYGVQTWLPHADEQLTPLPSGAQSESLAHGRTQAAPPEPQRSSAAVAANVM
ncbi:MAG TPA: hypothetical protein VEK07_10200, partial [Polyangiaceae bacterium]|nr:hypothetical protein [Polyangiaceae bacterium]